MLAGKTYIFFIFLVFLWYGWALDGVARWVAAHLLLFLLLLLFLPLLLQDGFLQAAAAGSPGNAPALQQATGHGPQGLMGMGE